MLFFGHNAVTYYWIFLQIITFFDLQARCLLVICWRHDQSEHGKQLGSTISCVRQVLTTLFIDVFLKQVAVIHPFTLLLFYVLNPFCLGSVLLPRILA